MRVRVVDWEAMESAPRRSDADDAASVATLPELSTSFFPVLAVVAEEAAHDVLPISTAAEATKRRLARGILRRIAGVFRSLKRMSSPTCHWTPRISSPESAWPVGGRSC